MPIWKCASYSRLSKEDNDGSISNSILNQQELIKDFISQNNDIELVLEEKDDGYSGSNFDRPAFQKVLAEIKNGNINCIIVKDLSRFGRNYIEVGDYLEKIFPFMGVRFVAINDNYDSINSQNENHEILIPFKNLVNETFLRDTSMKIRSQLEIKRKNGEYIGAFAPYGYKKDSKNKNKLVIDEYASKIVKEIFKNKIEGYSSQAIADILNARGELSPYEYRENKKTNAKWAFKTIVRILENQVYIGNLAQGKSSTPNHKIKKVKMKPKEEWIIVKDTHEPIVDKNTFNIVANLLKKDTRTINEKLNIFSGMVVCGDCKSPFSRKVMNVNGKKYVYLVCGGHKVSKNCSTHTQVEETLKNIILKTINKHIRAVLDVEKIVATMPDECIKNQQIKSAKENLNKVNTKLNEIYKRKLLLCEDLKDKTINQDDFDRFNRSFDEKINEFQKVIHNINEELENITTNNDEWFAYFQKYKSIKTLTRGILVSIVREIVIYEDNRIEIEFMHQDKYKLLLEIVASNENGGKYGESK